MTALLPRDHPLSQNKKIDIWEILSAERSKGTHRESSRVVCRIRYSVYIQYYEMISPDIQNVSGFSQFFYSSFSVYSLYIIIHDGIVSRSSAIITIFFDFF